MGDNWFQAKYGPIIEAWREDLRAMERGDYVPPPSAAAIADPDGAPVPDFANKVRQALLRAGGYSTKVAKQCGCCAQVAVYHARQLQREGLLP